MRIGLPQDSAPFFPEKFLLFGGRFPSIALFVDHAGALLQDDFEASFPHAQAKIDRSEI